MPAAIAVHRARIRCLIQGGKTPNAVVAQTDVTRQRRDWP